MSNRVKVDLNEYFPRASASFIEANPFLQNPERAKQAPALGANSKRKAQSTGRPHVIFTLCRAKLLDTDAKWGSIKDLLDGLQYAGLISGDREDQITLAVYQQRVFHKADECTEIEIIYP